MTEMTAEAEKQLKTYDHIGPFDKNGLAWALRNGAWVRIRTDGVMFDEKSPYQQ